MLGKVAKVNQIVANKTPETNSRILMVAFVALALLVAAVGLLCWLGRKMSSSGGQSCGANPLGGTNPLGGAPNPAGGGDNPPLFIDITIRKKPAMLLKNERLTQLQKMVCRKISFDLDDIPTSELTQTTPHGYNILHLAAISENDSIIDSIARRPELAKQLACQKDNRGLTPIYYALFHPAYATDVWPRFFLFADSDVCKAQTLSDGRNPLHFMGDLNLYKRLMFCGFDCTAKDNQGSTPLDIASAANNDQIKELLVERQRDIASSTLEPDIMERALQNNDLNYLEAAKGKNVTFSDEHLYEAIAMNRVSIVGYVWKDRTFTDKQVESFKVKSTAMLQVLSLTPEQKGIIAQNILLSSDQPTLVDWGFDNVKELKADQLAHVARYGTGKYLTQCFQGGHIPEETAFDSTKKAFVSWCIENDRAEKLTEVRWRRGVLPYYPESLDLRGKDVNPFFGDQLFSQVKQHKGFLKALIDAGHHAKAKEFAARGGHMDVSIKTISDGEDTWNDFVERAKEFFANPPRAGRSRFSVNRSIPPLGTLDESTLNELLQNLNTDTPNIRKRQVQLLYSWGLHPSELSVEDVPILYEYVKGDAQKQSAITKALMEKNSHAHIMSLQNREENYIPDIDHFLTIAEQLKATEVAKQLIGQYPINELQDCVFIHNLCWDEIEKVFVTRFINKIPEMSKEDQFSLKMLINNYPTIDGEPLLVYLVNHVSSEELTNVLASMDRVLPESEVERQKILEAAKKAAKTRSPEWLEHLLEFTGESVSGMEMDLS